MTDQEPVTVAGPAFARVISEHIDRPVPEAACGRYIVEVNELGELGVWCPGAGFIWLDGAGDSAKNIRGLLLALRAGAIA
jgi:hypothetical protein